MSVKRKTAIHTGCQGAHGLGWLAFIPNPFFKITGDIALDILIGIGISVGIGLTIQKATDSKDD